MLDCSPFNIVRPYWFPQLNIELSYSPVWEESKAVSTGVWNQVNHRLLSVRQKHSGYQTWEQRKERWCTGMSQQCQLAEWNVWAALPQEMSLLHLFFTKIPEAWLTPPCQATHTQSFPVCPPKCTQLIITVLSLSLLFSSVLNLHSLHSAIYINILNPQSLCKDYMLLHNPWKVQDTSV